MSDIRGRIKEIFSGKNKIKMTVIKSGALWLALSFAVPAAVMTAVMCVCGLTPFGDGTLISVAGSSWFDSFAGMYASVVSGEGVFYHLNVGFGSSFYSEFASGLCSPFMFLSLFFGQRSLASAYTVITILRTGAAGATAWYMLRRCASISEHMSLALSCGYSLCGFAVFAAYYPSVADGAVFFPLLVTGIYGFVQASRPVRMFVCGVLFFLTCSRLTLLGIIISFVMYAAFYIRKGSKRQRVYKFAMFSATLLCAAATNAFLVIPEWAGAVYYKNGVFSAVGSNDILSDLCFGGFGTYPVGGMGLCLSGLLIVGFASFMFNKKISMGEKLSVGGGALLLLLCHTVPPLAALTLGFCNNDGEYVNAGFMLTLIALYCAARNFSECEGTDIYGIAIPAGIYALLAVISIAVRGSGVFPVMAEAGLSIFTCAVFVQYFVSGKGETLRMSVVTAAALAVFGILHCVGAVGSVHSDITADSLRNTADQRIAAKAALEESYLKKNEEVPRFYRTRSTDGVSESVDLRRNQVENLTEFAERLGIMRASEYGGADNFTEFTDMLFGIANTDYGYYTKEAARVKAVSPAYTIGNWDNVIPDGMNAFELQNYLAAKLFGARHLAPAEPSEKAEWLSSESERYKWTFGNETTVVRKYVFDNSGGAHIYMLVPDMDYAYAIDSDSRSSWQSACAGGIYCLNEKSQGDTVTLYVSADLSQGKPEPVFMRYNGSIGEAARKEGAEYISYRGSTVRFLFDVQRSQLAITSIPFENGWEITVNGEKVAPLELCGGLTGIRLQKGINSVVMTYTPPCFRISIWISAILLLLGLYLTFKVEHEAARRRTVRMAFRVVEMNISRMTADDLEKVPEEPAEQPATLSDEGGCNTGNNENNGSSDDSVDSNPNHSDGKESEENSNEKV